jgi:hypothetical protein
MPEAFAVAAVFFVACGAYVYAWLETRNPARQDLSRLQAHVRWLEDRMRRAAVENWDEEMTATLSADLDLARRQLEALARKQTADPDR